MKKNVLMAFILSSILLTSAAIACTKSLISLGTIIVAPRSQNGISLSKLQRHIDYNVVCGINSSNDENADGIVVGFGTTAVSGANGDFIFNETNVAQIVTSYQRPFIPKKKNFWPAQRLNS